MRASILAFGTLAAAQTFTPARIIGDNQPGVSYIATLTPRNGAAFAITGSVVGTSAADGTGVDWALSLSGFDAAQGPFAYHIHDQPVPADGNCSGTLAHLDPTRRGQQPPCDTADISRCEVGDLSGKYGRITTNSFSANFHDDFTSTTPGLIEFFGNRSVTFHLPNTTRIACANFSLNSVQPVPYPTGGESGSGYATGSLPGYPYGGAPYQTGSASGGYPTGTGVGPYPTSGGGSGSGGNGGSGSSPSGPTSSIPVPGETSAPTGGSPATGAAVNLRVGTAALAIVAGAVAMLA